jgi:hypothetical protein
MYDLAPLNAGWGTVTLSWALVEETVEVALRILDVISFHPEMVVS